MSYDAPEVVYLDRINPYNVPAGWYFRDPQDVGNVVGPYSTKTAAEDAGQHHCDALVALGLW